MKLNMEFEQTMRQQGACAMILFRNSSSADSAEEELEEFASSMKDPSLMVAVATEKGSMAHTYMDILGVKSDSLPQVRLLFNGRFGYQKYKFGGKDITANQLSSFYSAYKKGRLNSYILSEPMPEKQGDLRKVVTASFEKEVIESDRDVLLAVVAEWDIKSEKFLKHFKHMAKEIRPTRYFLFIYFFGIFATFLYFVCSKQLS